MIHRNPSRSDAPRHSRNSSRIGAGRRARTLQSCADYRALMPALAAGALPEAQRLLVEDHARECIPCRRHRQAVRAGRSAADSSGPAPPTRVGRPRSRLRSRAAAAAVVAALVAGVWASRGVFSPPQGGIVQVQSVDGRAFGVGAGGDADKGIGGDSGAGVGAGVAPLLPGDLIDGGVPVRTAAGSRAVFQLSDGSRLEAAGLTTFRTYARRRGHRVRVERGSVIVQAADQANRSLVVSTEDMRVSVKGTIFAVTHGVKGSRVSVIEGEVEVEQGRKRHNLLAGDQLTSRPTLVAMALEEEVGWSQDADRYLRLLEEFQSLRSELNDLMAAAPVRHSTRLLDLMPGDTAVYAAMPNAPATLGDLFDLVRSRMESSEPLAAWWQEFETSGATDAIEEVVAALRGLGDAMGEETVMTVVGDLAERTVSPLLVTETTDAAALREAIERHLAEPPAGGGERTVTIIDDPGAATPAGGGNADGVLVWITDDIAAASTSLAALRAVAANRDGAPNSFVGSRLHGRLATRYAEGAELLAAVDLDGVVGGFRGDGGERNQDDEHDLQELLELAAFAGLDKVQDLVVSRTQDGDRANVTATLSFDGPRSGIVSWLAEPGANGALEFFSPDASFVAAGVIEDPLTIHDQFMDFLARQGVEIDAPLAEIEAELGLSLRNDLLVHWGGEYAAGIDGPVLPTPAWKAVAAVYDAEGLQISIESLVEKAAELRAESGHDGAPELVLDRQRSNGRIVYRLALEFADDEAADHDDSDHSGDGEEQDAAEIFYTYFDGYMVSASNVATIDAAIRYRGSGASLTDSRQFLDLLPRNGYADFSAMVYNRLAETTSALFELLPTDAVTDDRQAVVRAIEESLGNQGPALYTVYAGRGEIVVTSSGPSLLAFSGLHELLPGQLFGLGAILQNPDWMDETDAPEPANSPRNDAEARVAERVSAARRSTQRLPAA